MLAATMSSNQGKNLRLWKVKQQGQMAGKSPSQEDWWFLESGLPVFLPRSPRKGCCSFSHCCETPDRSKLRGKKVYMCLQWVHHVREVMAAGLILEYAAQYTWIPRLLVSLPTQSGGRGMNEGWCSTLTPLYSVRNPRPWNSTIHLQSGTSHLP